MNPQMMFQIFQQLMQQMQQRGGGMQGQQFQRPGFGQPGQGQNFMRPMQPQQFQPMQQAAQSQAQSMLRQGQLLPDISQPTASPVSDPSAAPQSLSTPMATASSEPSEAADPNQQNQYPASQSFSPQSQWAPATFPFSTPQPRPDLASSIFRQPQAPQQFGRPQFQQQPQFQQARPQVARNMGSSNPSGARYY